MKGRHFSPILLTFAAVLILTGAGKASQWDSKDFWYQTGAATDEGLVDVFYINSTDVVKSIDNRGKEVFRAVLNSEEKESLKGEMDYARQMFGDSLNFFAPYYHQFTFSSLSLPEKGFNRNYAKVRKELLEGFDYYMEHLNGGRRFIVAGFSQGAMLTLDVLKHMTDEQYSRMAAAYMIGYRLSEEDLQHPHVKPADDAYGMGEVISFNTMADTDALWHLLNDDAATCINPLNWKTDSTPATLVFQGDTTSLSINTEYNVVIAGDLDPGKYHFSPLDTFCPEGNYHHWDLLFYGESIRENAMLRAYRPYKVRVACVGDSITFGYGLKDFMHDSYPAVLGRMLGNGYDVRNYGVSARTMMKKGDRPYVNETAYKSAVGFNPDIVVLMLGTNDSKTMNWKYKEDFCNDAKDIIESFYRPGYKPQVYVCLPPPSDRKDWTISDKVISEEIIPMLRSVAEETGAGIIDLYSPFVKSRHLLQDGVHPDKDGAAIMAYVVMDAIL